jgi:multidrug efflux pump
LKTWNERERIIDELIPEVQARANTVAGLQSAAFALPTLPGAGGGPPVQVVIGSADPPAAVYQVAQELMGRAWQSGLFAFVDVDMKYDRAQGEISIDRDKAASLGIDMEQLGVDGHRLRLRKCPAAETAALRATELGHIIGRAGAGNPPGRCPGLS